MRILLALAVVVVFAALMIFDTTALMRLTFVCFTGGCGVPVLWIAIAGGVLALAALYSFRQPRAKAKGANAKKAPVRKTGQSRPARAKTPARRKPKAAK
jgi:hypothetical protein